jgi:hypothetical protein
MTDQFRSDLRAILPASRHSANKLRGDRSTHTVQGALPEIGC